MQQLSFMTRLKQGAQRMLWIRPVFLMLAFASFAAFSYGLITKQAYIEQHLLTVVLTFIWSVLMYNGFGALGYFPAPPDKTMGFFRRVGRHIKRFYYKILLLLCVGGLVTLLYLIMRAFRV